MGQRARSLAHIFGFDGFRLSYYFETRGGARIADSTAMPFLRGTVLVLSLERRWFPCCGLCGKRCRRIHQRMPVRRWNDLSWAEHPVIIEYAPVRVSCKSCLSQPLEWIAWADRQQHQTRRLQQLLAVQTMSMPISHVAALHGLDWSTVRRCQDAAIERWEKTRPQATLRQVGVDEKYLGRRNKREDKFVTIVSNLATGEPVWIGDGRREETLATWLDTLSAAQKAQLQLFAMDMHEPFANAVRNDPELAHVAIVHDPFHVMKRAGEAVDEVRRQVLFRAGPELRAVGRGKRWLFLRAWVRLSSDQRQDIGSLLAANRTLMHAYTVKEQLRDVLRAETRSDMELGLKQVLRRTSRRENVPMRKLHDSLLKHFVAISALGQYHPPTGRIEALNNNWETLVRRGRGYRDLQSMVRLLRFMVVHPIRQGTEVERFLALADTSAASPAHAA
jgi:transposase